MSSAFVGAVLAVAVLCGTAVFGASLTYLTDTPPQYGQGFDAWFSVDFATPAHSDQLFRGLHRPGVTSITAGVGGLARINGRVVDALAGQSVRGPFVIPVHSGPSAPADDEVVLGAKTMRELGVHVGSTVRVGAADPSGTG